MSTFVQVSEGLPVVMSDVSVSTGVRDETSTLYQETLSSSPRTPLFSGFVRRFLFSLPFTSELESREPRAFGPKRSSVQEGTGRDRSPDVVCGIRVRTRV